MAAAAQSGRFLKKIEVFSEVVMGAALPRGARLALAVELELEAADTRERAGDGGLGRGAVVHVEADPRRVGEWSRQLLGGAGWWPGSARDPRVPARRVDALNS